MKSGMERVKDSHRLQGEAMAAYFDEAPGYQLACEASDACDDAITSDLDTLAKAREAAEKLSDMMSRGEWSRVRVQELCAILRKADHG